MRIVFLLWTIPRTLPSSSNKLFYGGIIRPAFTGTYEMGCIVWVFSVNIEGIWSIQIAEIKCISKDSNIIEVDHVGTTFTHKNSHRVSRSSVTPAFMRYEGK